MMSRILMLLILVLVVLAINTYAQDIVKVVTPQGEKMLRRTIHVEADVLYTSKYGMSGVVDEVIGSTIIHVPGIGYIRLADIIVPSDKASEAVSFLEEKLVGKTVYLDIDDMNVFDPQGYILAVVYLQEDPNTTKLINVNLLLVLEKYAIEFDMANEFKPSAWKLIEYLNETTTTTIETTTVTTTVTATSQTTTTLTPSTTTTTYPVNNTTTPTTVNETNTSSPTGEVGVVNIRPRLSAIPYTSSPPRPPSTSTVQIPMVSSETTRTAITKAKEATLTSTTYMVQPHRSTTRMVTKTVTITSTSYILVTGGGVTPFYATTPGIIMISILSALIGSLVTIILLRKHISG